jgi:predicted transcriptional regulator of viral defense system
MKRTDLFKRLLELERKDVFVLSKKDIEKLFPEEDEKAMEKSLRRMVKDGLLVKAARGIYVNASAASRNAGWIIEEVAKALRPGKVCYVSLESILSEYGVISQIPMSRLTVMTTGSSGVHETPYGVIEFTHTKRSVPDVLDRTIFIRERPLRIAKKQSAVQDLLRVGRNTDMIDYDELEEEER